LKHNGAETLQISCKKPFRKSSKIERRNKMISARNQIKGVVAEVKEGAVNGIVKVDAGEGNMISATISMDSIKDLGIVAGKEVTAVIKATSVMMANGKLNISARNQLTGTVAAINEGAVNAIVKLDVPGGIGITSTISMEAVKDLGLAVGKEATAIIKATSVMICA
jgi:molybdate transport system regulatory protein